MCSLLNRVRLVLKMESELQEIGAWLMLLSSFALFSVFTWVPHDPTYLYHYIFACFLIGALVAHGIQKTTSKFIMNLGINLYIAGWAAIANSLGVANTYLEVYVLGVLGAYVVFLGVVLYFLFEETPSAEFIATHIATGLLLMTAGMIAFWISYFELEKIVFYFTQLRRLPKLWTHKAAVAILDGGGFLLISLFMFLLSVQIECN